MSAKQIIQDICNEYFVDADELRNGGIRGAEVVAARGACIVRMKRHYSLNQIAAFLRVNKWTVCYHLYQDRRENMKRNARAVHARKRAAA